MSRPICDAGRPACFSSHTGMKTLNTPKCR